MWHSNRPLQSWNLSQGDIIKSYEGIKLSWILLNGATPVGIDAASDDDGLNL